MSLNRLQKPTAQYYRLRITKELYFKFQTYLQTTLKRIFAIFRGFNCTWRQRSNPNFEYLVWVGNLKLHRHHSHSSACSRRPKPSSRFGVSESNSLRGDSKLEKNTNDTVKEDTFDPIKEAILVAKRFGLSTLVEKLQQYK